MLLLKRMSKKQNSFSIKLSKISPVPMPTEVSPRFIIKEVRHAKDSIAAHAQRKRGRLGVCHARAHHLSGTDRLSLFPFSVSV